MRPNGIAAEEIIQKYIDNYLEDATVRALASGNKSDRSISQLPFFTQISDDRGSHGSRENRWHIELYANELLGLAVRPFQKFRKKKRKEKKRKERKEKKRKEKKRKRKEKEKKRKEKEKKRKRKEKKRKEKKREIKTLQ